MTVRIVFIITLTSLFWACQKEDELETEIRYSFAPLCTTSQDSITINCSDTLWVESKIPGFLIDEPTGEKVYFLDALMNVNFVVRSWSTGASKFTPDDFTLVYKTYCQYNVMVDYASMSGLLYLQTDSLYQMKVGVVFHKTGIYSVDFDNVEFFNHNSNEYETYGGGRISFYDVDWVLNEGYLNPYYNNSNNQTEGYNLLSESERLRFLPVDDLNKNKYFFINAVNHE